MENNTVKNTRVCTKCKDDKDLDDFYQNKSYHDGFCLLCKGCYLENYRKCYVDFKEYIPKPGKEYTKKCTKCKENKGVKEFSKQLGGKYGKRSACKICCSTKNKLYRKMKADAAKVENSNVIQLFRNK